MIFIDNVAPFLYPDVPRKSWAEHSYTYLHDNCIFNVHFCLLYVIYDDV